MALAARPQHDILMRPSIPLSATADAPIAEVVRPPVDASNDQTDQASGVSKEISPQEAAQAAAARKGDPETSDIQEQSDPKKKPVETKTDTDNQNEPDLSDDPDIGTKVEKDAPFWAKQQIAEIRRKAQDRIRQIQAAVKAEVGDDKWNQAWEAANANVVGKYRDEVKRSQAEARRVALEKDALAKKVADLEANPPAPKEEAKPDPRPAREDFDDPDKFANSLIEWGQREKQREFDTKQAAEAVVKAEADRVAKEAADKEIADKNEAEVAEENAKIALEWQAAVAAAEEKYGDWNDVVMRDPADGGPTVTEVMSAAMTRTDNGPEVAYFLALNPEESVRIAGLQNPILQYGEIMKISGRLSAPTSRTRARLPNPIKPIEGARNEPVEVDPDSEDMEAYFNRRAPQMQAERRPFFGTRH